MSLEKIEYQTCSVPDVRGFETLQWQMSHCGGGFWVQLCMIVAESTEYKSNLCLSGSSVYTLTDPSSVFICETTLPWSLNVMCVVCRMRKRLKQKRKCSNVTLRKSRRVRSHACVFVAYYVLGSVKECLCGLMIEKMSRSDNGTNYNRRSAVLYRRVRTSDRSFSRLVWQSDRLHGLAVVTSPVARAIQTFAVMR